MFVYQIQYIISAYDGIIDHGVASTLESAVQYCQKQIQNGERHVEDPLNDDKSGFIIYEFQLDKFVNTLADKKGWKAYNDDGKLLN